MLAQLVADMDGIFAAPTASAASDAFFTLMEPYGASYLQTRVYRRPAGPLTSARHFAAGGVALRIAPATWPGSDAFDYVCFECNPLLGAIRENRTRYRFDEFAPRSDRKYGRYWEALREARIGDALCATSYGPAGKIASLHLGFPDQHLNEEESGAIQMAGLMLTERLMEITELDEVADNVATAPLTPRERDSLSLVADGKTDWEISVILGISESTARFHIDNARRKLGAVSRSQAVAKLICSNLA